MVHSALDSVPMSMPLAPHCSQPGTPQPTTRLLLRNMRAAWIMSASADICCSPNMVLTSAKTRSQAAEFGEMANATRAASAHTEMCVWPHGPCAGVLYVASLHGTT